MSLNPILVICAVLSLAACGDVAKLPLSAGVGPHPTLPAPRPARIPPVHIAPAVGWPAGLAPPISPRGMKGA